MKKNINNKKQGIIATLVLGSVLMTAGCSGSNAPNNTDIGTISGGLIGGLIGSQFGGGTGQIAAIAGGAMVGAFLGNKIGASMDKTDQLEAQQALAAQQPTTWTNQKGNTYTVTPQKPYVTKTKQVCRQYTTTATIDGKAETIKGTACRASDGTWHTT